MISLDEAFRIVLAHTPRPSVRPVQLLDALGCILAQPIVARENQPPFSSSAVDGFAVRSEDLSRARADSPAKLEVVATARAGWPTNAVVEPFTAVKIMTGAEIPCGADAVLMCERVEQTGDHIAVHKPVRVGENVRFAGEELLQGTLVLRPGTPITPAAIALLGALGYSKVDVNHFPRVSILTTGDELVAVDQQLRRGTIRDSNALFLAAALRELGISGVAIDGRVSDQEGKLRAAVRSALAASEIVLVTGGVSVGQHDHVKSIFAELGVRQHFWGIEVKPGKPTYFGTKDDTLIFGLPGNPVAVAVLFYELVRPSLLAMMGHRVNMLPQFSAVLGSAIRKRTPRLELLRGAVYRIDSGCEVVPLAKQESHMLSGLALANCLICFPKERDIIEKGESVTVHLLPWAHHALLEDATSKTGEGDSPERIGRVRALSVSRKRGVAKSNVPSALLVEDWGIEGDAHAGNWHRQVSLLALESGERMREKGVNVRPGGFGENITTEFIDVPCLQVGDLVRIGDAELEITQLGKECHSRCAIYYRAGDCVMPREGVFARVLRKGLIHVGDRIELLRSNPRSTDDRVWTSHS